ncbi:hypothetical protein FKM82_002054 [Ascaphus truei]
MPDAVLGFFNYYYYNGELFLIPCGQILFLSKIQHQDILKEYNSSGICIRHIVTFLSGIVSRVIAECGHLHVCTYLGATGIMCMESTAVL